MVFTHNLHPLSPINGSIFVLWVPLPEPHSIKSKQLKILKLSFHDNSPILPSKANWRDKQRFLFNIPAFTDEYPKIEGFEYDLFFVVDVPEGSIISLDELTAKKIISKGIKDPKMTNEKFEEQTLTEAEGLHKDIYRNSMSIRVPPLKEKIDFSMTYSVIPAHNERVFFVAAVFSLIGLSILFTVLGRLEIDFETYNWLFFLEPIQDNLNTLFGGLFTACLAAIGLIRNPIMNRTRFWFLMPMIITAFGFMISNINEFSGNVEININ